MESANADLKGFTQPTTAPEKALHAILQWHTQHFLDTQLRDFLMQRKGRNKTQDRLYEGKYTHELVREISAEDRYLRKDCEGVCGLDMDPILCGQDIQIPPHTYMTKRMEEANGSPNATPE